MGKELGPAVGDNVQWGCCAAEHVPDEEVSSFSGGGELGKSHKVYGFRKPVDYGQDDSITMRGGYINDDV